MKFIYLLTFVLSFYNDIYNYLDRCIPFLSFKDRYVFVMDCIERVKAVGVMTDKEYCETQLKKKDEDFIEGRFLIHAMDYFVQTIL